MADGGGVVLIQRRRALCSEHVAPAFSRLTPRRQDNMRLATFGRIV